MILLISSKNSYATKRLLYEAGSMNYEFRLLDLEELINKKFKIVSKKGDILYIRNPYLECKADFLPQIIKFAKAFKKAGGRVVDENITRGDLGKGKWEDYKKLKTAGVSIPKTGLFQKLKISKIKNYDFVIKWIYGLKGRSVFLVKSVEDIKRIPSGIPKKELLVQEYIQAEYEYKVVVVGFKALSKVLKFRMLNSGFKIDYAKHQLLERSQAKKVCILAEKAAKTLGRELCKVDILERKGKFYVLEVNRFPGLEGFEELMKYNVFKAFLQYLQRPIKLV